MSIITSDWSSGVSQYHSILVSDREVLRTRACSLFGLSVYEVVSSLVSSVLTNRGASLLMGYCVSLKPIDMVQDRLRSMV